MRTSVLRWNRLKRRAAALGVDVQTLIRLDAAQQRETSPATDDGQRNESSPAAPKLGAYLSADTPAAHQPMQAESSRRS
ncbi:hypothetical protein [Tunturiibacter gelidoferens]|uniref:Uncharacterized protein n=1 Tax=Tunturiibacter gelidiferens TaxID=3069689 RepID=A0A9X0U6E7_9BACT|nr:hypothetical protein [Edaphobacter lichenicola]MBB5331388.1 hypothetical protein [Edaphobacter lichenicola]